MKKHILILFLATLFSLNGCAGSPAAIASTGQSDIAKMSNNRLITYWRSQHAEKFANEIVRRKLFTPREWESIKKGQAFIGMRSKAVWASAGANFKEVEYVSKNQKLKAWRYKTVAISFGPDDKVTEILKF